MYHFWTCFCLRHSMIGACFRRLTQSHLVSSLLLRKSAMRRDQVCPRNNKLGCLITHPLFAIYKPDLFGLTPHFRSLFYRRLSMSIFARLSPSQSLLRVMAPSPPLAVKIWIRSVEHLFTFHVSKLRLREWLTAASTKVNSNEKGSGLFIAKRGCVIKHPPFI